MSVTLPEVIMRGTFASRPAAGSAGSLYFASDTGKQYRDNGATWDEVTPAAGSVSSVALTMPAEFSVSGSPVTTSGTLAVSKATQSANTVFAGPTTGSAAAPTFRSMAPADLPLASSSAFGAVKVDGSTITASSGVISASGVGGGGAITTQTNVKASRAFGTVYHNTTSKPLFVMAYGHTTTAAASLLFFTDSGNPPTLLVAQQANTVANVVQTVSGWVLPGNYYKVNWDAGTPTLDGWVEWT